MSRGGEEDEPKLTTTQLLQLAETHLRLRNFSLCRQYALESLHPAAASPHHRHASRLLAVAEILSATDHYSVLRIDTFSNDHALIHSQFKHLFSLLDPIKDHSPLANEALGFLLEAYNTLSDPFKKAQFDSQLVEFDGGEFEGSFWTFCPYCYYVYQYARVYEGCCLRCQNERCRRAFHGVSLKSVPKSELDKGKDFSCFGYFPMGVSPSECQEKGRFGGWSPIVGLFPVRRIGKTQGFRMGFNDDGNGDGDPNYVVLDESEESEAEVAFSCENEQEVKRESFGGNVAMDVEVPSVGKPRVMKQKSVAWNAKNLIRKGRRSNDGDVNGSDGRSGFGVDGDDGDEEYCFKDNHEVGGASGCGIDTAEMEFFEEDGEIFVGLCPDDAL